MKIERSIIAITGAGGGLGAAMAQRLAGQGARLALIDFRPDASVNRMKSRTLSSTWWKTILLTDVTSKLTGECGFKQRLCNYVILTYRPGASSISSSAPSPGTLAGTLGPDFRYSHWCQ
jgi:hypothetical protein